MKVFPKSGKITVNGVCLCLLKEKRIREEDGRPNQLSVAITLDKRRLIHTLWNIWINVSHELAGGANSV